jgi:hypothetical protein
MLRVGAKLEVTAALHPILILILILLLPRHLLVTTMSTATIVAPSTMTTAMTCSTVTSVLGLGQRMILPNGILQLRPVDVSHQIRIRTRSPTLLIMNLETIAILYRTRIAILLTV